MSVCTEKKIFVKRKQGALFNSSIKNGVAWGALFGIGTAALAATGVGAAALAGGAAAVLMTSIINAGTNGCADVTFMHSMNEPRLMKLHLSVLTTLGLSTPKKSASVERKLDMMADPLTNMVADCLNWVKPRNGIWKRTTGIFTRKNADEEMPPVDRCMRHPWLCGGAGMADDGKSISTHYMPTGLSGESQCLEHPEHETGYENKYSEVTLDGEAAQIFAAKMNVENKCIHFGERSSKDIVRTSDCGYGESKAVIKVNGKAAGKSEKDPNAKKGKKKDGKKQDSLEAGREVMLKSKKKK
jgi:hypothetical protein